MKYLNETEIEKAIDKLIKSMKNIGFEPVLEHDFSQQLIKQRKMPKIQCSVVQFKTNFKGNEVVINISLVKENDKILVTLPNLSRNLKMILKDKNVTEDELKILEEKIKQTIKKLN